MISRQRVSCTRVVMYERVLFQLLFISLVLSKRHVIRNTPKLRQQGYDGDIDLGEVIAEAVVDSPQACGNLCKQTSACNSAMLMENLCRLFAQSPCQCSSDFRHIAGSSHYLIGNDASVKSFGSAMTKCNSLGAHSVHINSREEHDMIKQYIRDSGLICEQIWTGGYSPVHGSADITDWRWYYSNDFTGPSAPFTYLAWGKGQPSDSKNSQYYMALKAEFDYNFNDIGAVANFNPSCFLCECP